MFPSMTTLGHRASVAAFTILLLAVAGALRPDRARAALDDLDGLEGTERVDVLLAAGLNARAESALRARIAKGDSSACVPLLQLLVRKRETNEAARLLATWEKTAAWTGEAALFTTARVHELSNDTEAALAAYRTSAVREPLLADHATYRAGLSLEALGRVDEALTAFEAAGDAARTRQLAAVSCFRAAALAADTQRAERAQTFLDRVPTTSVIATVDRLSLQARLDRARRDQAAEARTLRALLAAAPATGAALDATERLPELEKPTVADRVLFAEVALANRHAGRVEEECDRALAKLRKSKDAKLEGRVRLLRGKAQIARRAFTSARKELVKLPKGADPADRAQAALEAARCLWRLGRVDACLEEYDAIARGDFPETTRVTAAWEAAREAKDDRRWEDAARRFGDFRRDYPSSDLADDAVWQRGRALAESGRQDEALVSFAEIRKDYPDSTWALEATYWSALAHRAARDTAGACSDAAWLMTRHPDEYWAQRARELRAKLGCTKTLVDAPPPQVDLVTWLADSSRAATTNLARASESVGACEPFRRARALAANGLLEEAEAELASLRRTADTDPTELVALSEAAWSIGLPREGMRGASLLKRRRDVDVMAGTMPLGLARLLYPVAHLDAVLAGAEENRLDPLFVFAVMREESWFDSGAVSGAGARGLLQIMPATGYDLAGRADLHGFGVRDLFDPGTNVRLGTRYLRELLDGFDDQPALALAAYNAGKDNATRWRADTDGPFDVDDYVAGITYRETYGYVQKVMRTWAIYRFLWGDTLEKLSGQPRADRAR